MAILVKGVGQYSCLKLKEFIANIMEKAWEVAPMSGNFVDYAELCMGQVNHMPLNKQVISMKKMGKWEVRELEVDISHHQIKVETWEWKRILLVTTAKPEVKAKIKEY